MLVVYKGYEKEFLEREKDKRLVDTEIENKINISKTIDNVSKKVMEAITQKYTRLVDEDLWITYEELSACHEALTAIAKVFNIKICVYDNNKYYNIYPVEYYDKDYMESLLKNQNDESFENENIDLIYSYVYEINEKYYVQYNNYEYDGKGQIKVRKRYNAAINELISEDDIEFVFEISDNKELYLQNVIESEKYKKIGIVVNIDDDITKEMLEGIVGYFQSNGIEVFKYENGEKRRIREKEYVDIARNEIGIPNFEKFKPIKIYKSPNENNETIEITQREIIDAIVDQIEISKDDNDGRNSVYRDIFVTAPTGAGKSVMFQIPAVYAANKFGSLTIVISPLVELMNDQVENLEERGYHKAARINSDINPFDKQEILKKIDTGEIDILYLSPEALLSYSIENIIGTRDISAIIIDEAHIVTTWGQGFRPDYWYLGTYIERLRRARYKGGRLDLTSRKYKFPVCTFTATAVMGGKDDGVLEISQSLFLRNPITYIGEIKREDIDFDIRVHDESLNKTETMLSKTEKLKERLEEWDEKQEKSLVYFPYNSTAMDAYYRRNGFEMLDETVEKIGLYTGQTDKPLKRKSAKDYKSGKIKFMFATKAFGMGIDIKDIKNVYHYAEAGNLNDYVQEIGRAARDKEMTGMACMDYYPNDMNYTKQLFGMSAIKQYHIEGCMRVLSNVYKRSRRQNNLITPQAFETVFAKAGDLENTVKTALLNIEKDLNSQFKIPVIITRPRSMFTSAFIVIDKEIKDQFEESEFYKYVKLLKKGRNNESERNYQVTDLGDIYSIDLKRLWEEKFSRMSFPQFKYTFYQEREKIFEDFAEKIYPRTKIEIQTINEETTFVGIKEKLIECIDKVNKVLAKLQAMQGEFTINELKKELNEEFKDKIITENIANGYFKCIEDSELLIRDFVTTKTVGEIVKYRINSSSYKALADKILYRSGIINELDKAECTKVEKYKNVDKKSIGQIIRALNLLSIFNLIQYDMYGGENPEIFIRLNDPAKIQAIADGKIKYKNKIVEKAKDKHERDVQILEKFILELKSKEERWNFVEDYFLGKDVLSSEEEGKSE